MITFVILHYKNLKDTIECINSLKKLNNQKKVSIVVVDNNSLNNSSEQELKKYCSDILLLDNNYGVAKAYNEGTIYAINKYHPDFVCVMNNDIIINQEDFLEKINDSYKKNKFDMLGTSIISDYGSVNPFPVCKNLFEINNMIKYNNKMIKIYSNPVLSRLAELYLKIKYKFIKEKKLSNGLEITFDAALHGCLIIFSKKYYEKEKYVLCNDTFLFHEEEFLYFKMKQKKYISVYDPSLKIIHKDGQTLNVTYKNNINRKLFKFKECNKSLNKLKIKLENDDIL